MKLKRVDTSPAPKSPTPSVKSSSSPKSSASPGPSRSNSTSSTKAPANKTPPTPKRQDDFDTGSPKPRSRRPSSASTEQVRGPEGSGAKPTTNADIRKWYLEKVGTIPELDRKWAAEGVPLEERARRAVAIRHDARMEARSMMSSTLEVAMLRARDFFTYGNINGPTFGQLVKKAEAKGLRGDDVFKDLIGSSNRTNQTVNQHLLGETRSKS